MYSARPGGPENGRTCILGPIDLNVAPPALVGAPEVPEELELFEANNYRFIKKSSTVGALLAFRYESFNRDQPQEIQTPFVH